MKSFSYDTLWQGFWGDMQEYGPVHRHIAEDLVRTVTSLNVQSVLDAGCGSGDNLAALARLNQYDLTGVDVSREALTLARSKIPSAKLHYLDIEKEILPEKFDLVISIQVVEHLLDDMAAFKSMVQMARGYVFISTMAGSMRTSEVAIGHIRNYSAIELRRKLEVAGLEVLRISSWGFPFYSPLYRSLVEWIPGGTPAGPMGSFSRVIANMLYHLYRLNIPNRGDVLSILARAKR